MKYTYVLFTALMSTVSMFAQTYITNVTVADVERQKLRPHQTVEITGALISDVQNSKKIKIPETATVIDGTGKFLIPGLVDAHIHFFQSGGLYTRPDAIDLRKYRDYDNEIASAHSDMEYKMRCYLQNGITTVFDVGATFSFLEQRKAYLDKSFAPAIFMTGPLLTTYEPAAFQNLGDDEPFILAHTVEEGVAGVQKQLPYHPDFIKIWYIAGADGLSVEASAQKNLPMVKAVIDEAHRHNLKVAVHATQRITAQLAVENGADFLVHSIDDEILKPDFVQLMKANKTVLCPTLVVHSGYVNTFAQHLKASTFEIETADPYQLGTLLDLKHLPDTTLVMKYKSRAQGEKSQSRLHTTDSISKINLKLLSDAGVLIATGTDAGNIGTMHAASYLEELKAMQASGMSTWQLLQASTVNGAKILDKTQEMGTIKAGKKANLVLLDANPVDAIENWTKIHAVINKGSVFKPETVLKDTPADIVQRQVNAYNFRNIDAFLATYADDVEIYNYPDELRFKGKEAMRTAYAKLFDNTPNLHCEIPGRIVQGNIVIDKERVQVGETIKEAVAMYFIEEGKIKKVYFIK